MEHDTRLDAEHRRRIDAMPAAAIGEEVWLLRVERFEADSVGLSQWAAYLTDLDDEIAACLHEFIRASVTEIALLRAAATGALLGLTAWAEEQRLWASACKCARRSCWSPWRVPPRRPSRGLRTR